MTSIERMQADDRKADILKAALAVFAVKGFAATTTKDLAKAAKVSEGLLYKHFPSKESLYQALGKFVGQQSSGVSQEVAKAKSSTQSLVVGIYYLTRIVLQGPCGSEAQHDFLLRMMCRSLLEDGVFATTFMEGVFFPYIKPLNSFFDAARKSGDLLTQKKSDTFGIFFAHHLMVGIRLHALRPQSHLDATNTNTLLGESVLYNLRGIGLKPSAIKKYCDLKKLDIWFAEIFNLKPTALSTPVKGAQR